MSDALLVLVAAVFIVVLLFLRPRGARSGTHSDVPDHLRILKRDTSPEAFLGFCTRDEDALYFTFNEGVFLLDYELNTSRKKRFETPFRDAVAELGLAVTDATYGEHPVLRVKLDGSEEYAAKVGFELAEKVFGHNPKTVIEFLP